MTTRRGKCGGRAGRRLGTPRTTNTRCSPRLHKPSWPGGATPRSAVPQSPAAPRARGASGRRAPRALAPHGPPGRSGLFLQAPSWALFLSFPSSASPQRALQPAAKFSHDPGVDIHEMVGGGGGRKAGVRSAARPPSPAGKLRGRVRSSRGRIKSARAG